MCIRDRLLLIFFTKLTNCEVYYITPSTNGSCKEHCITLSQFADSINQLIRTNTTLIFSPGSHSLSTNVSVSRLNYFSMKSANGDSTSTTICMTKSVSFQFNSVTQVHIDSLTLRGCTQQNTIDNVISTTLDSSDSCLLYTSPSPRDATLSRMPSSA